jgi:hypothetical protein
MTYWSQWERRILRHIRNSVSQIRTCDVRTVALYCNSKLYLNYSTVRRKENDAQKNERQIRFRNTHFYVST